MTAVLDVLIAWHLTYLVHSTVLLGGAALTGRWTRSGRTRELLLRIALLAPVVSATTHVLGVPSVLSRVAVLPPDSRWSVSIHAPQPGGQEWLDLALQLAAAIATAVGVMRVVRLVLSHAKFRRAVTSRRPVTDRTMHGWLRTLATTPVALSRSSAVRVPVAFGAEVCLPERALTECSRDELLGIVAHEVAHLRRGDERWLWTVLVVQRLFVIQPFNAWAVRELRALSECACDDWARAITGDARSLASALARVAGWPGSDSSSAAGVAVAFAHRDHNGEGLVVQRLRRLLAESPAPVLVDPPTTRGMPVVMAAAVLGFAGVLPGADAGPARQAMVIIRAVDPQGAFTLTLVDGRVRAATIDGVPLAQAGVVQAGRQVSLVSPHGREPLRLTIASSGTGIAWAPRAAAPPRASVGRLRQSPSHR